MRVNVETRAVAEQRFENFCKAMNFHKTCALGTLVFLWMNSQEALKVNASKEDILEWLAHDEHTNERIFQALIKCKYLVPHARNKGIYEIRGNARHVNKLSILAESGRQGGLKSGEKRRKSAKVSETPDEAEHASTHHATKQGQESAPNSSVIPLSGRQLLQTPEGNTKQCNAITTTITTTKQSITKQNTESEELRSSSTTLPGFDEGSSTRARKPVSRGAIPDLQGDPTVEAWCEQVSHPTQKAWCSTFVSASFVREEIKRADVWMLTNPQKKPKNFARFMSNWLNRAYEQYRKGLPSRKMTSSEINAAAAKDYWQRNEEGTL